MAGYVFNFANIALGLDDVINNSSLSQTAINLAFTADAAFALRNIIANERAGNNNFGFAVKPENVTYKTFLLGKSKPVIAGKDGKRMFNPDPSYDDYIKDPLKWTNHNILGNLPFIGGFFRGKPEYFFASPEFEGWVWVMGEYEKQFGKKCFY